MAAKKPSMLKRDRGDGAARGDQAAQRGNGKDSRQVL
jgi:hypothetical protein